MIKGNRCEYKQWVILAIFLTFLSVMIIYRIGSPINLSMSIALLSKCKGEAEADLHLRAPTKISATTKATFNLVQGYSLVGLAIMYFNTDVG